MTALKKHGKLLLVVLVPVAVLVIGLTALLTAGNTTASKDRAKAARAAPGPQAASQAGNTLGLPRLAQAGMSSPVMRGSAPSAQPAGSAGQGLLKIYRCPPGKAEAIAAQLHQQFGGNPSVRIVGDVRTSQLLVMAPQGIQAQIAQRLPEDPASAGIQRSWTSAPGLSTPSASPGPSAAPMTQQIQLWQTTGQQFEAALVRMLAGRLTPVTGPQQGASAYRLALADRQVVRLTIDRAQNRVQIAGTPVGLGSAIQLIHVLDSPQDPAGRSTRLISVSGARSAEVRKMIDAIRGSHSAQGGPTTSRARPSPFRLAMAEQTSAPPTTAAAGAPGAANAQPSAAPDAAAALGPGSQFATGLQEEGGLIGPVQVEPIPGTDILVIRGHERDVQKVMDMIDQIEQIAEEEKPVVQVQDLQHVDCRGLALLLNQLYEEVFAARQGDVSITALVRPNALLLVGREESVKTVQDLVTQLDRPVPPDAQFQVFRLKSAPAERVETAIEEIFQEEAEDDETGLGTRVQVTHDFRTNSLIVRANPRDLAEVAAIIERMDTDENETLNQVRIFKLKNSLAEELAPVLQDAITGPMYGQRTGTRAVMQRITGADGEQFERKSTRLQFITTGGDGQRGLLNSGILNDAQVTADARANALIVTAAPESMPLIEALIEELDALPTAEAVVKVFTLNFGDASVMAQMLNDLFGAQAQADLAVRTGAAGEDSSLVSMRFALDVRTNSIIASGSSGDLEVVEAIVASLDASEVRVRRTAVVRLKNAEAENVAAVINDYIQQELETAQPVQGFLSSVELTALDVVVVPEVTTNSLIISSTDQYFDRITELVSKLDARPPMVVIQVLIAAVDLEDTDEFGVELGLQDSILFDRSVGGIPGFLFNDTFNSLGNNTTPPPPTNLVGTQGLSNLSLGRQNGELGYGGFVFSASSESVSVLIRALQEQQRLEVLARPQIATLELIDATVHVGEQVPYTSGITPATGLTSQTFNVGYQDVGIVLSVAPRVNPDGLVTMELTAIQSKLGPEDEGVPVSVSAGGEVLRQPRIDIIETNTTVSAMDGQTIVLGGFIEKVSDEFRRQVPWLGDIPVLGHLFRYEGVSVEKRELLIIMTPHVVESDEDVERIKQIESARMQWCYADVLEVHGDIFDQSGLVPVIYPDLDPSAPALPMEAPMPEALKGARAPKKGSPFMAEPLRPKPDEKASPHPPVPPPDQAAAPPAVPAGGPVPFDRVRYSVAGPAPPWGAGRDPRPAGWPSGVEQATYEMRLAPPGETTFDH